MKRILLSVFAAAVTAAMVVPTISSASDVTFGGQYRVRGEYRNNSTDWDKNLPDATSFTRQRVRLTANANATDDTSVKLTLQDTRTWGQGGTTLTDDGSNTLDLHEAYVNVKNIFGAPVAVRAGRQELAYGDQRLIGSFGWSDNGRAFDGLKFTFSNDMANLDVFRMTVVSDTTTTNDGTHLTGGYLTLPKVVPNNTIDAYLINKSDNTSVNFNTYGLRVKGMFQAFDYTAEVAYQSGDASDTTKYKAHAYAVMAGYTLPTPMKIRVGAEYDLGTGDKSSTTSDNEGFNNLYPTNHGHFGIADISGVNAWSNLKAWSVNAKADVNEQVNVYLAYWNFKQDQTTVAVNGDKLGSEIDLVANYKYNNAVGLQAGWARFSPNDAMSGVGNPSDSEDFGYLELTANF